MSVSLNAHDCAIKQACANDWSSQVDAYLKNGGSVKQLESGQSGFVATFNNADPAKVGLRGVMFRSVQLAQDVKKNKRNYTPTAGYERRKFNADAVKAALAAGLNRFTGQCKTHGLTEFYISGKAKDHVCLTCKAENRKRLKQSKREKA